MRPEKQLIVETLQRKIQSSPFVILTDYIGLTVQQFSDLRVRLRRAQAELHVVKNTMLALALKGADVGTVNGAFTGMTAMVTGSDKSDVCAVAKIVKLFNKEFEKPAFKLGVVDRDVLNPSQLMALAELPPLDSLRAMLLGLLQTPATRIATVLAVPAGQIARVLKAHADKQGGAAPEPAPAASK